MKLLRAVIVVAILVVCSFLTSLGFAQEDLWSLPIEYEYLSSNEIEQLLINKGAEELKELSEHPYIYRFILYSGDCPTSLRSEFLLKLKDRASQIICYEDFDCPAPDKLGTYLSDQSVFFTFDTGHLWNDVTQYCFTSDIYLQMTEDWQSHHSSTIDLWIGTFTYQGDKVLIETLNDCEPIFSYQLSKSYITNNTAHIEHQNTTFSQLVELDNEFESSIWADFEAPYIYRFDIWDYPKAKYPENAVGNLVANLKQKPKMVIGRSMFDNENYCKIGNNQNDALMINNTDWEIIDFVTSDEFYFETRLLSNNPDDTCGVSLWMSFDVPLGDYIEFDPNDENNNYPGHFKISGFNTHNNKQIELFGYNPVSFSEIEKLLTRDNANNFIQTLEQPYLYNLELKSGADIDNAVKINLALETVAVTAIGKGSGNIAPQAAIGDAINNQHNVDMENWEDLTEICNTNNLYSILNDDPNTGEDGTLSLWFGFDGPPGHNLYYENLEGYLLPESININAYRVVEKQLITQVDLADTFVFDLEYLQSGDNYYTDRNYYLTSIPEALQGLVWLQTPNDEKNNTINSFITLNVNDNGTLYIAYDSRATSLPQWIVDEYELTEYRIGVSDEFKYFNVYKKDVTSGELVLGGNMAEGAVGAESQYVVLFDIVESLPPVADFNYLPKSGAAPLTVQFTDQSTGFIENWEWDFGDGESSSEQNPEHNYAIADTYYVSLTVSSTDGSDSKTDTVYVTDAAPIAAFSADTTNGVNPLSVQFTDESTGSINAWVWDFGDGNTSTEQNPVHEYTTADTFDVSLIVSGPGGTDDISKENYIIVVEPLPVAQFKADVTEGLVPLTVQYADSSTGPIASWLWEFGDGNTSTEQSPQHVYTRVDTFTVTLTVTGPGGVSKFSKTDYIQVQFPTGIEGMSEQPTTFALYGNYPNPFNPNTHIVFDVPKAQHVTVSIYNVNGGLVETLVDEHKSPGRYTINWQAGSRSSGTYFIRMVTDGYSKIQKCVLLK